MAAVDQVKDRLVVRDVQRGGSDERLASILGRGVQSGWVVQVRRDGSLEEGHERRKIGLPVGCAPESAEQEGGIPDGFQALAPDIADDDPGPVRRTSRGIQIAADLRLGFGGQVDRRDPQRADTLGKRLEHHLLRSRRNRPQLTDFPFMALTPGGERGRKR